MISISFFEDNFFAYISILCYLQSQNRMERLKKTKNIFCNCVLDPFPVWEASFLSKKSKKFYPAEQYISNPFKSKSTYFPTV
jgi:hypothetical protein